MVIFHSYVKLPEGITHPDVMDCDGIWWFLKSWRIPKSPLCVVQYKVMVHDDWMIAGGYPHDDWKPPCLSTYGFLGGCCSELFQLDVPSELPLIFP